MLCAKPKLSLVSLISLGTAVENKHNKKNLQNLKFYRLYYEVIKNKPNIFQESIVQLLIFR